MRKTGLDVIAEVPWGTHFCQFYHTRQDLTDVLVPYFQQGLRQNEFCMWVTSEPLTVEEATVALRSAVGDLDDYLRKGQIEILDYRQWYTASGRFEADRVLRGWVDKERAAAERGFDGLRLTGNTFWLEKEDWREFAEYEATVNNVIGKYHMIAVCTYSLDKCGPRELIDVVSNHQFALIKHAGAWKIIESQQHRTFEAALRESNERLNLALDAAEMGSFDWHIPSGEAHWTPYHEILFGYPPGTPRRTHQDWARRVHPEDLPRVEALMQRCMAQRGQFVAEYRVVWPDGSIHWVLAHGRFSYDAGGRAERMLGVVADSSERKRTEDALRSAHDALGMQVQEQAADLTKAAEALETEARGRLAAQQRAAQQAKLFEAFFKHAITPLVFLDRRFNFLRVNEAYAKACRREVWEFPGHNHFEFYPHEENEAIFREVVRSKVPYQAIAKAFRFPDHPEWGTTYWDWTLVPILDAAGEVEFLVFSLDDVTQRTEAERRNQFTTLLLELFAKKATRKEYLEALVSVIRQWSGCRCVGIRVVDERGNIPYESYVGFSREFWELENWLCLSRDICICIRVIAQTLEPQDAAIVTPGGSFRCDNAIQFVGGLSPEQQARFRGNCVRNGFASIAVVPIRHLGQTLGAVHLADEREGAVPPSSVEFLESLMPLVGEAIHRFNVEEQLRGAYCYARSLIEASLDPLVTINAQGQITDVNKATEAVTGVPRQQLIGSDFSRYFTDPQKAQEGYQQVLAEGLVRDYPLTIRHAAGETADVLYNATVYRNEAGQVEGVFAAARDITERKKAEKALWESEQRYRSLTLASTSIVWTTDARGEVVEDIPYWRAFTGQNDGDVKGWGWTAALHPEDRQRTAAAWSRAVETSTLFETEYRLRRHDGKYRHMAVRGVPVREQDGSIREWVGMCTDITEQQDAEERVRLLHQALQRRAAQLQTLASELTLAEHRERRRLAQILHDHLQQLLYAARLNLSGLRRKARGKELQQTIGQIDELLGQCIDESRSLTIEISPPVLYDGGLAAALQWLARHVQQTYGLAVEVEVGAAAEPDMEDIRVLLFESVRELLFNVVKHAEAQHARVSMATSFDHEVQIVVADEGVGFDLARLQLGEASAAGFGLFSIRERLEAMGGGLEVDTAPGQGTRVTVFAPQHQPGRPPKPPAAEALPGDAPASRDAVCTSPGGVSKIRVLLADDHAIFRTGLVDLLQQEPDIEVVAEAADGEMAVAAALRSRPHVVLMDVGMPRLDGIEATRRIAAALPGARVIGLSGNQDEDMAAAMRQAGAVLYLVKDSPPEALVAAIRGTPLAPAPD
jgi:PAS domain S-box-containing protein